MREDGLMSICLFVKPIFKKLDSQCFFFNDTATTEIYTLSLHDALPICEGDRGEPTTAPGKIHGAPHAERVADLRVGRLPARRSEEHTSELQSLAYLVCRLLLEKKKNVLLSTDRPRSLLVFRIDSLSTIV